MLVTVHLIVVIMTALAVVYSDEQALLWMIGKKQRLNERVVTRLHGFITIGLGGIIVTGGVLYAQAPIAFLTSTVFLVKMVAVGALIINTYAIGRLAPVAIQRSYAELAWRERFPLFLSGIVSVGGWITAGVCGYILS